MARQEAIADIQAAIGGAGELHPGRGRPRVDDERKYGEAIVQFITDYIQSHGQMTTDSLRVREHEEVFGAPLDAIQKAAKEKGFRISRSALWNLLARRNISASRVLQKEEEEAAVPEPEGQIAVPEVPSFEGMAPVLPKRQPRKRKRAAEEAMDDEAHAGEDGQAVELEDQAPEDAALAAALGKPPAAALPPPGAPPPEDAGPIRPAAYVRAPPEFVELLPPAVSGCYFQCKNDAGPPAVRNARVQFKSTLLSLMVRKCWP